MSIETEYELDAMIRVGSAVAAARDAMLAAVRPGISTLELDRIGESMLAARGCRSAPRLAYGFPGSTCVSVNDALAHGIPSADQVLRSGDVVNVDVSAELGGFWADTGASTAVGTVGTRTERLLAETRAALSDAIAVARPGVRLSEIGRVIERRARRAGLRVVRDLSGHGVGRHIHEDPVVPNHYDPKDRTRLHEGLVITIEPFFTLGSDRVIEDEDGWTLRTGDGSVGAQFEHTIVITDQDALILT
ncbi:MAG: type I methionyl aminopeptidase [Candidatus Eisenbacteria bacterium]